MKATRCVWILCVVIFSAHSCTCVCKTEGSITVCPYPVIVFRHQDIRFDIFCNAGAVEGDISEMKIAMKVDSAFTDVALNSSEGARAASTTSLFSRRSRVSGNDTFLILTVSPASVGDMFATYQCSVTGDSTQTSTMTLSAGAYPEEVTLTSSLPRVYHQEKVITLDCRAAISGLAEFKDRSLAKHIFQYKDKDGWVTLNSTNPSYRGQKNGEADDEGKFMSRTVSMRLLEKFIPECCLRFRCYLTFEGHSFETLAHEYEGCPADGQGKCANSLDTKKSEDSSCPHALTPAWGLLALAGCGALLAAVSF